MVTLRFFRPATSTRWSVEAVKSFNPYDLPDQPISFATIDERTLGVVLRAGHATANNEWTVTRDGVNHVWFCVGDTRQITLTDDSTVTMRIIGIDHDDLPNGGKAALTCDFVEAFSIPETDVSVGNYATSPYRTSITNLYELLPEWLRSMVVKAKKATGNDYIKDYVWAFSVTEIGKTQNNIVEGTPYPYYTDASSRRHKDENDNIVKCFLRTTGGYGRLSYLSVYDGMEIAETVGMKYDFAVIGFCLNAD